MLREVLAASVLGDVRFHILVAAGLDLDCTAAFGDPLDHAHTCVKSSTNARPSTFF